MVSIIILSYNTRDLLRLCLQSVFTYTQLIKKEVIVVDNHSTDGSAEMVQKEFPKSFVIKNASNDGFAKGCNKGASVAHGSYLLFLNSDTELSNSGIKKMVDGMENDETIGVMGGRLINSDKTTSESYGTFYSVGSILKMLFGRGNRSHVFESNKSEVDWVSGGFMLIKKDLFEKIKGFDERFFMYVEDVDLCFRVKQMGLKVLYFQEASALHKGQGSSTRTFAIVHIYQGILLYFRKHKSFLDYTLVKMLLTSKGILAIILGTITRNMYLVTTYKKALRFSA